MSKDFPLQDAVVCKPSKWFLWRALAMLVMFSVFAVLFFQDGMWGYRKKNLHFYVHHSFINAGKEFQRLQNNGQLTESSWKDFANKQKVAFPENGAEVLPKDVDLEMSWPEALVGGFAVMDEKGGQNGAVKLWEEFTASRKEVEGKAWDVDTGEKPYKKKKISEQFIAMGVALTLILIVLFFLFRTLRRNIAADGEALYTQEGKKVLYADMVRVDKRKWDTKGIALVYYMDGGEEKKAKIDGMVYGQFKEEDGAPAEKLFSKVMENFKGEVIEYAELDEDEDIEEETTSEKE